MKNTVLPFLLLFILTSLRAADPQPVASVVREVTIFKNGAQITRTASQSVGSGRSELIFKGFSPNIKAQSIQIKAGDAVTIMSVNFRLNYLEEIAKTQEIKGLEAQISVVLTQIARLNTDLNVYKQEENLLSRNQVQIIGVPNNPLKTQDLKELADFQRTRLSEVLTKQYEVAQQIKQLEEQAATLQKQVALLNSQKNTPSGEILVVLNAAKAGAVPFTLSYYVDQAGWAPFYDLRIKDVASPVSLLQKASLYQQTGETWTAVKLSLSTGDPAENNTRPVLAPWRLRYTTPFARMQRQAIGGRYTVIGAGNYGEVRGKISDESGETLIGASISIRGMNQGTRSDVNGDFVLKLPPGATSIVINYTGFNSMEIPVSQNGQVLQIILDANNSLQEVVVSALGSNKKVAKDELVSEEETPVTVLQLPTTYLYEIDQPVTLDSDGKLQMVDIKTYELPAGYRYYCAPKKDNSAFLTAQVTGWETIGLLSGEANLFFEGTFLGKSYLEFANTSDTLQVSLGRDKNISVSRTQLKEFSKRQFLSGKKEDSRSFEIAVKNKKSQAILLILEDQIPISTNKNININQDETSGAGVNEETGILSWTLNLGPAEDKKLRFGYTVKYPKEKIIALE